MPHTYTSLLSHIVFSTKDRVPLLDTELKARLFPYLGGIIRELGGVALSINGPTDHVHVLASLPPTMALSDVMAKVKANSSGWIHKTFPNRLLKKACFEKLTPEIIGVFAWFFARKRLFQQPANRHDFRWQTGYGAFSVSVSQRPRVLAYIAGQEEHHRKVSFKEEFLGFLKKHGVAYDERYVFD